MEVCFTGKKHIKHCLEATQQLSGRAGEPELLFSNDTFSASQPLPT